MPDRCEDDIIKKLNAKHAKILEMKQKEFEERMAEEERLQKLDEERREEEIAEWLKREKLTSIVLSSRPRITWRVDDPEMQSSEDTEREKSGTSNFSETVSIIIEAENLLDGYGAHPETIPNLIERIRKVEPFSPELEDSISAEHYQLQVMAKRTMYFLLGSLYKRNQDWKEYKRTYEIIKNLFKENREILHAFPSKEKGEKRGLIGEVNYNLEDIKRSLSSFEELEKVFAGDEQWYAFENEYQEMEQEYKRLQGELRYETVQVKYFKQSAAGIVIKMSHVEELIGLLNQNQFATLSNTIGNALKSLDAEIEKVENEMRECELNNKFIPINFTRIEDLHSKLKILKDDFSGALENQRKVPETEKTNQEKAILEMFRQLTPEDACNLLGKLQESYGVAAAKPEEKVEVPNTVDMPAVECVDEDPVQELATADEPIDPNDLSVEENFQRLLAEQAEKHEKELEAKRRERAEKKRAGQEEIRAWASQLQNSRKHTGSRNN